MQLVLSLVLLAGGAPAKSQAPFEGVLEYRLVLQGGEGAVTTKVSPVGVFTVASVKYLDQAKETTVVVRARDSDVSWVWEPREGHFSKLVAPPAQKREFIVEAKGPATVAGTSCQVVVLKGAEGTQEYCTAVGFLGDGMRETLVAQAQRLAPDVEAALRSVKAFGLVLRLKQTSPDGKVASGFELVKVRRERIDKRLFDFDGK